MHHTVLSFRCAAIREGGLELHKLLKETNRKLKVSAGLPEWKNYVDFVNSLVRAVAYPVLFGNFDHVLKSTTCEYIRYSHSRKCGPEPRKRLKKISFGLQRLELVLLSFVTNRQQV